MPITRSQNFSEIELNIVGSSTFGRYPKISIEKTYNMFESDGFLIPYSGYKIAISNVKFGNGTQGRGIFSSAKLKKIILVIDDRVYLVDLKFNQQTLTVQQPQIVLIGTLETSIGVVYIAENNKPQILFSDNEQLYLYDPSLTPRFQTVNTLNFTPGYITFHDTYFICAARQDSIYNPPATNTWRLSGQNDGLTWSDGANSVGLLQTKPDRIQAVVRFPSKGNMIFVMGSVVSESWFNTGAQLFPYQRTNQFNIDYGCLSPASVASMDEIVVWLAANERSGPVLMYSKGGMPEKITTDGIDYIFGLLQNPEDSQGFLYRQDGHLFYHINFYKDNLSFYVDFLPNGNIKIYNASDQNLNYYIASQVAFFNNQYYFVSKNNGNLYILDTIYTIYEDLNNQNEVIGHIIPRIRTCKNIRLASQEYFIANDLGFTIESGETDYFKQSTGPVYIISQDNKKLISQGYYIYLISQDDKQLVNQDLQKNLIAQLGDENIFDYIIAQEDGYIYTTPRVDLSISTDGGATFGNDMPYVLPGIGQRKNKLQWWQIGLANDLVVQIKFWTKGRVVCTNGIVAVRT